ncbi:MAG TPA: hypothetical protein VE861_02840, partial [Gemmatimonadaceae bacterium]|nr:hypothetical protein [Gemmatimonadaceae bacterium]
MHRHVARLRLLLMLACAASPLRAQVAEVPVPTEQTRKHLVARRAAGRIVIDGRLTEADWGRAGVGTDFAQTRPDYRAAS